MKNIKKSLTDFDLSNLDMFETMVYSHNIQHMTKEESLQIIINNVEGDFSQLSDELAIIAEKQESIINQ